jgi:enamine deaminase RidA (YjgF/YER057c/UK114 family)
MSEKQYIQPEETFESERFGFTQVVSSPPGRMVFVSGQVAFDRDLKLVGEGDLAAQAEQALANLGASLAAAGARPEDITMLRSYIVDYDMREAAKMDPHFERFFAGKRPASTRLGVQALAVPGLLIEIDCVAVVPEEG